MNISIGEKKVFGGVAPRQERLKDYRRLRRRDSWYQSKVAPNEVQVIYTWKLVTMKQVLASERSCFTYKWNKSWFMVAGNLVKLLDG